MTEEVTVAAEQRYSPAISPDLLRVCVIRVCRADGWSDGRERRRDARVFRARIRNEARAAPRVDRVLQGELIPLVA